MQLNFPLIRILVGGIFIAAVGLVWHDQARPESASKPSAEALAHARATVKMMDDLHKGYVVHITDTYVRAQEVTPAARVTKKVFKHMAEQGWGSGRLIDASGKPFNEANLPRTAFEKTAVAKIKSGMPYFDEVATKDGKQVLRAATIVPAVMDQCIKCHTNAKKGDLLGGLVYEVPIR